MNHKSKHSISLVFEPFRITPVRSVIVVCCLLLAGLGEAVGVASLLPILSMAGDGGGQPASKLEQLFIGTLDLLGVSPSLVVMLVMIVFAIFLKSGLTLLAMTVVGTTAAHITLNFRRRLISALMVARWPYFISRPIGSLTNAVGVEADSAVGTISNAFRIVAMFVQVSVYLLLALVLNAYVTLFSAAAGIFLVLAFSGLISFSRRAGARITQANESLQMAIADGFSGIKPLRAMARERRLEELLKRESENLFQARRHLIFSREILVSAREPVLIITLAPLIYVAMTHLGMPFEQLIVLAYLFYRTINSVGNLQQVYQGMVSSESFYRSMQEKISMAEQHFEDLTGPPMPALSKGITIKNLSLDIEGTSILGNVSLEIPAHSITAIVGPSGAGKTTLVDIILGFHEPTGGSILIDGIPFTDRNVLSWRQQVGYVPQEMLLFHDTVQNNVTLGDNSYSDKDIEAALRAAGAWEFIDNTPKKLQTVVGEKGARLSGGQRQRLAIARALLSKPKLLILDEPTTALDPTTEAEICNSLKSLGGQVTILLISHQPALIAIADEVIHLSHGRIVDAA
jgi:ATP-binding cassette, subfamily C, bacterial